MADVVSFYGDRVRLVLASFGYGCDSFELYLVKEVIDIFHDALDAGAERFPAVVIINGPELPYPDCSILRGDAWPRPTHLIRLAIDDGTLWCQLAFQLAHEYCHHLINGPLSGDMAGVRWFEETLCECASQFALLQLSKSRLWDEQGSRWPYAPALLGYLQKRWQSADRLASDCGSPGWLSRWASLLGDGTLHRHHYTAIARWLLPLFAGNPRLWRLLLSVGDTTRYKSLEDLFAALDSAAEEDWRGSYQALKRMMIG